MLKRFVSLFTDKLYNQFLFLSIFNALCIFAAGFDMARNLEKF